MPESSVPVIAIDGPGGSGKGTVARAVARVLGWHMLDSGALYRLVGLLAAEQALDAATDASAVADMSRRLSVDFRPLEGTEGALHADGRDVTELIRSELAGQQASRVAAAPEVRAALVERQRAFRRAPGLVADGRDMGSVIFPDAGLKIFLTASVAERAQRRHKQLKEKGIDVSLAALCRDMQERDLRDEARSIAPLRACQDARILDTTGMSIAAVVSTVLRWAAETYPGVAVRDGTGGPQ